MAVGCWMLWGWRNKELLEADFLRPTNMTAPVLQFSNSSCQASPSTGKCTKSPWEWRWISWIKLPFRWLKLDIDGDSKGNPGLAGAGGVLRDSNGRCTYDVGMSSAVVAGLWGAFIGLRLMLEVDFSIWNSKSSKEI
ncbi:hypothetical protein CRG98_046949 [Punica granatum]|uniref:RNase H type-1 domain-containing protein n=1 Tax=Punica granatum TaxID=22663 RepID=A0A2I0HLN2_PUNGR|nr:hypothetical protein CRG98_046949 [Punica granatum]